MTEECEQEFEVLKLDDRYEISTTEPWNIRKIGNQCCITQTHNAGYIQVGIGKKTYTVHRLVAFQFIHNDDPEYKIQVNHIDRNKLNNSIENLRWVTPSENNRNRNKYQHRKNEYLEELPPDSELIEEYNGNRYDRYFYNIWDEHIYMVTKSNRIKVIKPYYLGNTLILRIFDSNDKSHYLNYNNLIDYLKHNY